MSNVCVWLLIALFESITAIVYIAMIAASKDDDRHHRD